jgi:L-ascorbate metabolism protein UlaG (beta-lactamase superfamily)
MRFQAHRCLFLVSFGAVILSFSGLAQESQPSFVSSPRRLLTAPEALDAPDEWIGRSLKWVNYILKTYPPDVKEHPVRRAALIRLDDVLHIKSAPDNALAQVFYRQRIEGAVQELEQTRIVEGMRVWKLYNHGFVVRTPTVTFAFDIVPGALRSEFVVPGEILRRLVAQCDALFLTHAHNDHVNPEVARLFLAQSKPVLAPPGLWSNIADLASRVTYPERAVNTTHRVSLKGGASELKVVVYPGHQGKEWLNNVYLVTSPEGFTAMHTGDQSGPESPGGDFDWMAQVGGYHHVDVLLPNCWANGLERMLRGINPDLVITGHENELSHSVDHREDYTQTYNRLFGSRYPAIVMSWGESYHIHRPHRAH